ncbi:VOC family protein [Streptomyces sp. NPDC007095]|jgi:hypothetical protein|uniref:VOC family protein n=1 Tax=Streptomyces sp. NPDC007095 TaxID=3154482 RepID=UPI0033DF8187
MRTASARRPSVACIPQDAARRTQDRPPADAAELEPGSSFWHRMLGDAIEKSATHPFLRIDGSPVFVIQLAPERVPPQWPDGRSQQMHVDLTVDHLVAADRLALEAGPRRLRPTDGVDPSAAGAPGRTPARPGIHSVSALPDLDPPLPCRSRGATQFPRRTMICSPSSTGGQFRERAYCSPEAVNT